MKCEKWSVYCLIAVLALSASAARAQVHRTPGAVPNRYIVLLDQGTPASEHAQALAHEARGTLIHTYTTVLNGFSMKAADQAAEALTRRPGVEAVWEVPTTHTTSTQSGPHYGLDRIDQRALPLDDVYTYFTYSNPPVRIYIADTGVDPNEDFEGRLVGNVNLTSDANGHRDPNDYTDYGLPLGDEWHGTATAILAAGRKYGVAKFAKIVNVRVLRYDTGSYDDVVAGIDWITSQRNAYPMELHVANASFGSSETYYAPAETAFRNSVRFNVAWIFSAGNESGNACYNFPANLGSVLSGAITVGAMNPRNDAVLNLSNQGQCVEIFAPSNVEVGLGVIAGGTSASAPHVAGVFAIRWASASSSTAAEIEGQIKGLGTPGVLTNIWSTSPNLLLYSLRPKSRAVGS